MNQQPLAATQGRTVCEREIRRVVDNRHRRCELPSRYRGGSRHCRL
jgi:hypothetical protein